MPDEASIEDWKTSVRGWQRDAGLSDGSDSDHNYYCGASHLRHLPYSREHFPIQVRTADGPLAELTEAADSEVIASLAREEVKPFVCGPKEVPFPRDSSA
jgi:hypothetical protein